MAKIRGQFDVSLSVPIDVAPGITTSDLEACNFQIEENMVTILPLNITPVIPYPNGDYEPPKLTEIRVWIIMEIDLVKENGKSLAIPLDKEQRFETLLVDVSRRFVRLIKHKTNQWHLDTRHPVHAYSYKYWLDDVQLGTVWPQELGSKRLPEYAHGRILFHSDDFRGELSHETWQDVITEISQPTSVALNDELLHDAKNFRSEMRYDVSVLYAAIASEFILEKVCVSLLKLKKGLSEEQSEAKASKMRVPQLLKLMSELDPTLPLKYENVRSLFHLRNNIAHGKISTVLHQEANGAIRTAEQLKRDLAPFL